MDIILWYDSAAWTVLLVRWHLVKPSINIILSTGESSKDYGAVIRLPMTSQRLLSSDWTMGVMLFFIFPIPIVQKWVFIVWLIVFNKFSTNTPLGNQGIFKKLWISGFSSSLNVLLLYYALQETLECIWNGFWLSQGHMINSKKAMFIRLC